MAPPGVKGRIFDRFGLSTEGTLIFYLFLRPLYPVLEREREGNCANVVVAFASVNASLCVRVCM